MAWIIIPIIFGMVLSLLIPQPKIGLIQLNDAIYYQSAQDLIKQIIFAGQTPDIRAVVLVLNSPGGTVSDTESVYMELAKLRQKKPVITIIESMAASGGYYLAVGTDFIFAKPSSSVGNIGVIGYLPPSPEIMEETYSTGPYKLWGAPRDRYVREIEMLKKGFLQAVLLGRGDHLKINIEQILSGEIWAGSEAVRLGLVDELGGHSQVYDKAAAMSKISHFEVVDLRNLAGLPEPSTDTSFYQTWNGIITAFPRKAGIYYLFIPDYGDLQ
jgi:protease IV